MESTLLLSATYEPIKVISWKRAIVLLVLGKVDVLETYDTAVHSPSTTLQLPAVVKLHRYVKHLPRRVKFSRQNLYQRDNYTCQYCHKRHPSHQLTYDHVVPRSRGGQTTWTNIVTACTRCNLKKGNKLLHQVNFTLLAEPTEPRWLPAVGPLEATGSTPPAWHSYLSW
ncbi:MAG: HNH endonuclease, partial [Gammaproteobacteria bacterium]|nr:HNH endonuclease [Gammaproteobacteria bacterium]NIR98172.1 HNH endonuclease [Gammaproteobacteria bacterium]NIT63843.1 HNH endonuclease [Gammaproteobacteria bacterium]NIV19674.1 HNH endonuclease [Gammaproteobacteria bacterium]NIY32423.1 HNH endonuclease [Gammaproteobacteria bacterium]